MDRWVGKTAVVTGASAGIGAAVCVGLANAGLRVVGLARRPLLVEELKSQIQGCGSIVSRQCNVADPGEVAAAFQWIEDTMGAVNALVSNAGVFTQGYITDLADGQITEEQLLTIVNTNVVATMLCNRHAIASMKKHNFDGHIININSIAGHYIPFAPFFNVYSSSKHAVTAFTGSLANELAHLDSNIKLTSISPGLVDTAMAQSVQHLPMLRPADVADAALYALATPPTVNITELTIQPVREKRL